MNDHELLRYSRHILLDEIGIEGQTALLQARVLVIGCGGLGAAALSYLTAAGVGHLVLVDDDHVDLSNVQRQILYRESDVGALKAQVAAQRLTAQNPHIHIETVTERVDEARLRNLTQQADIVLDCTDNFPTRHALNRAAHAARIPLVSGAATRFSGQVAVFDFRQPASPCYACAFPDADGTDGACALFGVFSPLVGIIGTMQAAETLKLLMNVGQSLHGKLTCFDAKTASWQTFSLPRNPQCAVCGDEIT
ncbi:MAG: HesA/MoeB/ThiF family protein [Neisseria sp.]|nr:HesA/MoeB/ThiF family protein [Neisseria sp.]